MRTCSVPDCDRRHGAKGFCLMHYKRVHDGKYGVDGPPPTPTTCTHCDRPHAARGLCQTHWQQWKKWGDPLHADKQRAARTATRIDKRGYEFDRGPSNMPVHRRLVGAKRGEVVHHIDGCKDLNELDNLVVLASQAEHKHVHHSLELAAFELVRSGAIAFDRSTLRYHVASPTT